MNASTAIAWADHRRHVLDPDRPEPARIVNYGLGGKDHFAADRAVVDQLTRMVPHLPTALKAARRFAVRAVRHLAAEAGIRQFVDLGCGLPQPTGEDTHQIAQAVDPAARVVYVDHDPMVMAHARALLTGTGSIGYVEADLCDPLTVLADPELRNTVDLDRPVGLLLCGVLHFVPDHAEAVAAVRAYVTALAPGSYVVLSHASVEPLPTDTQKELEAKAASIDHVPFRPRGRAQIAEFLDGLDVVDPGLVTTAQWRPGSESPRLTEADALCYAAVARVRR